MFLKTTEQQLGRSTVSVEPYKYAIMVPINQL